jgi:NAD(P)-dependent dehydrogenase (short-subunit alcohol dehydrogenase family)
MSGRLEGKVAVVTGAGAGMGKAIVERFVREGAKVVAADISGLQNEVAEAAGPNCVAFQVDVSKSAEVKAMLDLAVSRFGGLHVLCNNAGIQGGMKPTGDYDEDTFDRVMAVNAKGVFLGMRHAIPIMLAGGGGSIVNTASMAAVVAFPQMVGYCGSKGAVRMMTKTTAVEYADKGIRVNCFCPGSIDTNMVAGMPKEYIDAVIAANPVKRIGKPREIADLALFLACDESSFITGTEILIDGGYTAL